MRPAFLGFLAAVLLLVGPLPGRVVSAGDDDPLPEGMSEADVRKLQGKLRSRASTWWGRRKQLVMMCPQCKGAGKVRWRKGRRRALVDCPKCDGNKVHVDKDRYRYCFYDMRSPAYRLQEGIRARLTEEYVKAREGKPFPKVLKRYSIAKVEIVDASHGIVYVKWNRDSVARPQRWVWADEPGSATTWYLHDAAADGPWPGEVAPAQPPASVPARPVPVAPPPRPPPPPPRPPQPEPEPTPQPPPGRNVNRDDYDKSVVLVDKWEAERTDYEARMIRIELALDDIEGREDKVKSARTFIKEAKTWLEEVVPVYERAKKEVREDGLGVGLKDRIEVNTMHFKAFRRIKLTEDMLLPIVPDLLD